MIDDDLLAIRLTLEVAALSTAIVIPLGIAAGLFLSRFRGPGRSLLETLVSLPLVLPPTAVGLILLEILRRSGPVGRALDAVGIEIVFTWKAVVLATTVMSLPLFVRSSRTAFEEVNPRLEQVARTLGIGPVAVFFRVTLPLAWRGLLGGALLAFCRALGEFGATIVLAGSIPGRTQTIALAIFQHAEAGHDREALQLVWVTMVLAFVLMWASERASRRKSEASR